jgi:uncharacterized protein YndB with AHSA1/START domain
MREPPAHGRTDSASIAVTARPDAVYGAFADPAALMKWLPPGRMTGRALEYDFREGGRYRIELTYGDDAPGSAGKTTARTDVSTGRFLSLDSGKRIVQSVEFDSADASFAGEMIMTWTFEPSATETLVTIRAENVPPGINKADHDAGLRSSLENLARYLGSRAGRVARAPGFLPRHRPDVSADVNDQTAREDHGETNPSRRRDDIVKDEAPRADAHDGEEADVRSKQLREV